MELLSKVSLVEVKIDRDVWQSHLGKKGKQQSNRFLIDKKLEAMLVTSMC